MLYMQRNFKLLLKGLRITFNLDSHLKHLSGIWHKQVQHLWLIDILVLMLVSVPTDMLTTDKFHPPNSFFSQDPVGFT